MAESCPKLDALRRRIDRLSQRHGAVAPSSMGAIGFGVAAIDAALGGGLARAALHEIIAADTADAASAAGFAAMLAFRAGGTIAWLRAGQTRAALHAPGLSAIGIDPAAAILVAAPDPPALLRAAGEVARCGAIGIAVIELWREPRLIDLTASRRLLLAAEGSGVTLILLRIAIDPLPSAAVTRWGVKAAPSQPLAANAPGAPTLDLTLLRRRGGPADISWRIEWDRECGRFREPAFPGAVVPVPRRRSAGGDAGEWRAAG